MHLVPGAALFLKQASIVTSLMSRLTKNIFIVFVGYGYEEVFKGLTNQMFTKSPRSKLKHTLAKNALLVLDACALFVFNKESRMYLFDAEARPFSF
jgi:hypothetical protein